MNRLALLEQPTTEISPSGTSEKSLSRRNNFPASPPPADSIDSIATLVPIHYEPGYAYPLLVWLHGAAGNEQHLTDVMPHVSLRNYVSVAPRGTVASACGNGYTWQADLANIDAAAERVFSSINLARQRFHIHPRRVFIAGEGWGGAMAVRLAWQFPDVFAGAASLVGGIPTGHRPLRHLNRLRRQPLLLAAGIDGKRYSERDLCSDLRLLHSAGAIVSVRQYPCGDELRTPMLNDLDRWLMDLVCQSAVEVQA